MKRPVFICLLFFLLFVKKGMAQFAIEWNAWANLELSEGQRNSHYYYNQIHEDYLKWRVGLSDLNIASTFQFIPSLKLNVRGRLLRDLGAKLDLWQLPLLNLQYLPKGENWSIMLGRFIAPIGGFSDLQHPKDRIFIGEPLRHSFYLNVSPKVGFAEAMGENRFEVGGEAEWGSSILYYAAYTNGIRFNWDIVPNKFAYALALTNAAPNALDNFTNFSNWGIINRFSFQPTYFWKQGLSVSYGSFFESDDNGYEPEVNFRQLIIGTDFNLGYGFWEFTGEVLYARYEVPEFFPDQELFSDFTHNLSATAFELTAKYELPFLSGLYTAIGIEGITFGQYDDQSGMSRGNWDNEVWRLKFGAGYKINSYLLFRLGYNIQQVENHPVWEQNTFRSVLTIHY